MEPTNPAPTPAEARQRWRLVYRRRPDAPPLPQRDQNAAWEAALLATGLPIAGSHLPVPRARLAFGAPLSVGMAAERELMDMFLVEPRPVSDVRTRLLACLPSGHELVDLHDVWLGEPPLAGRVVAADYRLTVTAAGGPPDPTALAAAARNLLAAAELPRSRDKGGKSVHYDLRPLLDDIEVVPTLPAGPEPSITIRIRVRFAPERGVGRPEEVLAALSEAYGTELHAQDGTRERLYLADDVLPPR